MKQLFIITALVMGTSFITNAGTLDGSWKEVRRLDPSGKTIDYTDTIRVEFKVGNQYLWMKPNTFQYRGAYAISGHTLDLGIRTFEIISDKAGALVLKDEAGTYTFNTYNDVAVEDNSAATNGSRARNDAGAATGAKDLAQLTGQWEVYKRTNGGEKVAIDYTRIIRMIVVSNDARQGIYAAEDAMGKPSWTIERLTDNTLYCKGRDARQLKVIQCSAGELILQEGAVTYFFKQFKG